jgi:hypothetical protein
MIQTSNPYSSAFKSTFSEHHNYVYYCALTTVSIYNYDTTVHLKGYAKNYNAGLVIIFLFMS